VGLALTVVGLEALVVALAIAAPRWGFLLASVLLSCFIAGMTRAILRGDTAPCRCFGASRVPIGPWHIARNAFLLVVSLAGAVLAFGPLQLRSGLADEVVGIVLGLLLGGIITRWEDIVFIVRGPSARVTR
jgi:hypothetical protein